MLLVSNGILTSEKLSLRSSSKPTLFLTNCSSLTSWSCGLGSYTIFTFPSSSTFFGISFITAATVSFFMLPLPWITLSILLLIS